ncbi:MAG: hypothetical protein M1836_007879 [Candelina mexicana]|nr:MAG: hypothetical protein M1836_007879 [Candelina mexicana]
MADRIATRSLHRRNTPQTTPATSSSPLQRTTRTTRSQSKEIASVEPVQGAGHRKRKGVREFSVDSEESQQSVNDDRAKGGKNLLGVRAIGDLSTVPEDPIVEYPDLYVAEDEDEEAELGLDERAGVGQVRETVSPGRQSNFSGTTALTTHSAQELADLDPLLIVEALEDLSDSSTKVLRIVTPTDPSAPGPSVVAKELKIPGSRTAKRLSRLEAAFKSHADHFGNETYINNSIILRALTGLRSAEDLEEGPWRPDTLFQKANITTLVTKVLTAERESPDTSSTIEQLDRAFPVPFLRGFATASGRSGTSKLIEQTLKLALNIRTQLLIIMLFNNQSEPNYDPDSILRQVFFESFGKLKGWETDLGDGIGILPKRHENQVDDRLTEIRNCFLESSQAVISGDSADLEQLDAKYSWPDFLVEVVTWAGLRLDEVERQIHQQGGVKQIVAALGDEIERRAAEESRALEGNELLGKEDQPQIELEFEAVTHTVGPDPSVGSGDEQSQASTTLLPAATLPEPNFATPSAVSHFANRVNQRAMARLSEASSSTQVQPPSSGRQTSLPRTDRIIPKADHSSRRKTTFEPISRSAAPLISPTKSVNLQMNQEQGSDGFLPPNMDDDNELPKSSQRIPLASQEDPGVLMGLIREIELERNKENTPQHTPQRQGRQGKRFFIEAQPTAQRLEFGTGLEDTQASQKARTAAKGKRRAQEVLQVNESEEDDGFEQMDDRTDVQNRRAAKPTSPRRSPVANAQSSPKRQRVVTAPDNDEEFDSAHDSEDERATQQAASRRPNHNTAQAPNEQAQTDYQKVNLAAKRIVSSTLPPKVQSRRAWEPEAEQKFIEIIEEHGTSWTFIENLGEPLLAGRNQTNLKDKARNMHFDFLKSRVPVPRNLDRCPLNKNQRTRLAELDIPYHYAALRGGGLDD